MIEGSQPAFNRLVQDSLGPWFTVWAIRRRWNLDRKLSPNARLVRWGVVIICYTLGVRLDSAVLRVFAGLIGLAFLCWPNFAYHLTGLFERWPTTQGSVSSVRNLDSRWHVDYSFEFDGQRYGGTSKLKPISSLALEFAYPEGAPVTVSYDPLNPENSAIMPLSLSSVPGTAKNGRREFQVHALRLRASLQIGTSEIVSKRSPMRQRGA